MKIIYEPVEIPMVGGLNHLITFNSGAYNSFSNSTSKVVTYLGKFNYISDYEKSKSNKRK